MVGAVSLLAVVGVATSAHAYFDLTHAYETESHRYDEAVARFVSARLGSRYVTIVAAHDWDVDDVNRYLAIAAYNTLSGLAKRGVATKTVYRVVKASELGAAMASPPTTAGRGLLLAEQFLVREPFEKGVDVRTVVTRDLPGRAGLGLAPRRRDRALHLVGVRNAHGNRRAIGRGPPPRL